MKPRTKAQQRAADKKWEALGVTTEHRRMVNDQRRVNRSVRKALLPPKDSAERASKKFQALAKPTGMGPAGLRKALARVVKQQAEGLRPMPTETFWGRVIKRRQKEIETLKARVAQANTLGLRYKKEADRLQAKIPIAAAHEARDKRSVEEWHRRRALIRRHDVQAMLRAMMAGAFHSPSSIDSDEIAVAVALVDACNAAADRG